MAVFPNEIVDGVLHEDITGGLFPPVGITIICPHDLEVDAPLESATVTVTK